MLASSIWLKTISDYPTAILSNLSATEPMLPRSSVMAEKERDKEEKGRTLPYCLLLGPASKSKALNECNDMFTKQLNRQANNNNQTEQNYNFC